MTLDEALRELGLLASSSFDERRRAYLRLLKTRKPDVDPEGFMRLRAAYEKAKSPDGSPAIVHSAAPPIEFTVPLPEVGEPHEHDEGFPPAVHPLFVVMAEVQEEIEAKRLVRAGKRLITHLDESSEPPFVVADLAIRLTLDLFEDGKQKMASGLLESFRDVLARTGSEAQVMRGPRAVMLQGLLDLMALSPSFPVALRQALVRGVRALDFEEARAFVRAQKRSAGDLVRRLHDEAPVLARLVGLVAKAPEPAVVKSARKGPAALIGVVAIIGLRVTAALWQTQQVPGPTISLPPSSLPAAPTIERTPREKARDAIRAFAAQGGSRLTADVRTQLDVLDTSVNLSDCAGARRNLALLIRIVEELPVTDQQVFYAPWQSLRTAVTTFCPAPSSAFP